MVKTAAELRACLGVLLLAACVLLTAAELRGPEYDEQYTLFLTAGLPRPIWPETVFPASLVQDIQARHGGIGAIARDLRATDVHPPLYFWLASLWRDIAGQSLFALRLLSVLFGLGALVMVGVVARLVSVRPALAMLLTLGCYGFAYTCVIARGFMLAQLLVLAGLAVLLSGRASRRCLLAGLLFGSATMANYLAVFVPLAAWLLASRTRPDPPPRTLRVSENRWSRPLLAAPPSGWFGAGPTRGFTPTVRQLAQASLLPLGMLPFLAVDFWFFLGQHNARPGQFPPFEWLASLTRLGRYAAANLLGGLPHYVEPAWQRPVSIVLGSLLCSAVGLVAWQWRRIADPNGRRLLLAAAVATPLGLLALGRMFDNTPIELRYLSFSVPFIALLLAGALGSLPPRPGWVLTVSLIAIQCLALAGMASRIETMQPARDTAQAAMHLARDAILLLPRGNDGVGIVGAFARELPPATPLLLIEAGKVRAQIAGLHHVALAALEQDDASRLAVSEARMVLAGPCWRQIAGGSNLSVHERQCDSD